MTEDAGLIWCPFPDAESAEAVISALLDARLVACGNIVPGVRSLFSWQGARDQGAECGVLLKTTAAGLNSAMDRLGELHPYDAPAIMGWTTRADRRTLAWLIEETAGP